MDTHKFYASQEPTPEEFDEAFTDSAYNILRRFGVITQPGIVPAAQMSTLTGDTRWTALAPTGTDFTLTQRTSLSFDIGSGLAFTNFHVSGSGREGDQTNPVDLATNRILITPTAAAVVYNINNPSAADSMGNPTPKSTGCREIPVGLNQVYYVYLQYLPCVDTLSTGTSYENKYSLNPASGQLGYTHWIDGYQVVLLPEASPNLDYVYLGKVTTGGAGITNIDMSGRTTFYIPGTLVASKVLSTLAPAGYTAGSTGSSYTFTDHINAYADIAAVSAANPHGTTVSSIPGLEARFGLYSDHPEYFFTNGIIDTLTLPADTVPGPFWGYANGTRIYLNPPRFGQSLVVDKYLYDINSRHYAEVTQGNQLVLVDSGVSIYCEFAMSPATTRPTGYYIVYVERAPYTTNPGMAVRAAWCGAATPTLLQNILENPGQYLTNIKTQYPVAVVNFNNSSGFVQFTQDPQTRWNVAPFYSFDMRRYGTIGDWNVSSDRRSYDSSHNPVVGNLQHNSTVYSDHIKWTVPGNAAVLVTKPVLQSAVKKVGRVRRVVVYSDTMPQGAHLTIDVTRNGVANSIFSVPPRIKYTRLGNTTNYAGVANAAVVMDITTDDPHGDDEGKISTTANYVAPGDRLQLLISTVGTTVRGGNDLVVTVYID